MEHIRKFNESISENKTQLEADVELKLIKFFEEFGDRQWIVDRFNEEETKNFINYMKNIMTDEQVWELCEIIKESMNKKSQQT